MSEPLASAGASVQGGTAPGNAVGALRALGSEPHLRRRLSHPPQREGAEKQLGAGACAPRVLN